MRALRTAVTLVVLAVPALAAANPPVSRGDWGGGPANPGPGGRDACWSEPGDMNGFLGSSEIISTYGLESEIANDFFVGASPVTRAIWWAGEYNPTTPCRQTWPTPGFNLRFYEDAGCVPGAMIAEFSVTEFTEEFFVCPDGWDIAFKYTVDVTVAVVPDALYWFGAQLKDHPFPGQGGRLTSAGVVGCESVLKSVYFGFPDWTPSSQVWDASFDFGQEFECGATAVETNTWGRVKAMFR